MDCSSALFTLMSGAVLLSLSTLYFYYNNFFTDTKKKNSLLMSSLTSIEYEKKALATQIDEKNILSTNQNELLNTYKKEVEALRQEVASLKKVQDITIETATKNIMNEQYKDEVEVLRKMINRLQNDNQLLIDAYRNLEKKQVYTV